MSIEEKSPTNTKVIDKGYKMKLIHKKVRQEKYYAVGYEQESGRYILSVVITWIAWYKRYYLISEQEYEWFDTDIAKLDLLAEECYRAGPFGERFLQSERSVENG